MSIEFFNNRLFVNNQEIPVGPDGIWNLENINGKAYINDMCLEDYLKKTKHEWNYLSGTSDKNMNPVIMTPAEIISLTYDDEKIAAIQEYGGKLQAEFIMDLMRSMTYDSGKIKMIKLLKHNIVSKEIKFFIKEMTYDDSKNKAIKILHDYIPRHAFRNIINSMIYDDSKVKAVGILRDRIDPGQIPFIVNRMTYDDKKISVLVEMQPEILEIESSLKESIISNITYGRNIQRVKELLYVSDNRSQRQKDPYFRQNSENSVSVTPSNSDIGKIATTESAFVNYSGSYNFKRAGCYFNFTDMHNVSILDTDNYISFTTQDGRNLKIDDVSMYFNGTYVASTKSFPAKKVDFEHLCCHCEEGVAFFFQNGLGITIGKTYDVKNFGN